MDNAVPWLQDDPYREICRRIQTSLAFATRVSCDEDPDRVELKCGHATFSNSKNCWHIRHRAISLTSEGVSVLGGSVDEFAISNPAHVPAKVVARLQYNGNDAGSFLPPNELVPPPELVQWLLKVIEFRSMLLQAKASQAALLCRSREQEDRTIDLNPIFQKIQQEMMPSKGESLSDLLEAAIAYVSSRTSDLNKSWEVHIKHSGAPVARSRRRLPAVEAFCRRCMEKKRKGKIRSKKPARSVADNTLEDAAISSSNTLEDAAVSSSNETIRSGSTSAQRISRKRRRQSQSDQEIGQTMQDAVASLAAQKSTMSTLSDATKIAGVALCEKPAVPETARRPPIVTEETTDTSAGEEMEVPVEQGQAESAPEVGVSPFVEKADTEFLTFTRQALLCTFDNLGSIMDVDKGTQSGKHLGSVVSLPMVPSTTDSERVTPKLGDKQVLSLPIADDLTDQRDNDADAEESQQLREQSVSVICLPTTSATESVHVTPNLGREPVQPLFASIGLSTAKLYTLVQEQPTISKRKQPTRKQIFIKEDQSRASRELENSVNRNPSLSIKGAEVITLPGVSESTENQGGSTIMTGNDMCETLEKPLVLAPVENCVHRDPTLSMKGAEEITLPGVSESTENEGGSTIMTGNDMCETLEKPSVLVSVESKPTSTKNPATLHLTESGINQDEEQKTSESLGQGMAATTVQTSTSEMDHIEMENNEFKSPKRASFQEEFPATKAHANYDASAAPGSPLNTEESKNLKKPRRSPIKRFVWDDEESTATKRRRAAESEKQIPMTCKVPKSSNPAKHSLKSPPAVTSAESQAQIVTARMSTESSIHAVATAKKRKRSAKVTTSIEKVNKRTTRGRASRKVALEPMLTGGDGLTTRTVAKKRFTEEPLPKRRPSVVDDVEVVGIEEPKQEGETIIGIDTTTSQQDENNGSSIQVDQDTGVGLDIPVSDWVALSHLGLISDYHGLQRRYDSSFLPLKFNTSVVEIMEAIEKTLADAKLEEGGNDYDEEAEADLKIADEYEAKATVERAAKKRRLEKRALDIQTKAFSQDRVEIDTVERHPMKFVTVSQFRDFENDKCDSGDACAFCHPKQEVATDIPPIRHSTFREIDIEEFMLQDPEKEEGEKRGKRRSRTAGLIVLRNLSAAMLSEMQHTLKFIEEYNQGTAKDQPDEAEPDTIEEEQDQLQPVSRQSFDDAEDQATNRNLLSLRIRSASISYDDDDDDDNGDGDGEIDEEEEEEESETSQEVKLPQPIALAPEFVKLGHAGLVHDYQALQGKFPRSFLPLSSHDTMSSIRASIEQNLGEADAEGSSDEEATAVKKAYLRIVRGYQGKADQEKIEKKVHEEERQLNLREYQYNFRKVKKTQDEVELQKVEKRPLHFVTESQWNQAEKNGCKIGKDCIACGHVEENEVTQVAPIINPRFRMINLDKLHEVECEQDKAEKIGRKSRTAELNAQKRGASRALSEIRYTLQFIDTYNEGLIKTKRKK